MRASSVRFKVLLHLPHVMRVVVIVLLLAVLAGGVALSVRGCSGKTSTVADGGIVISGVSAASQFFDLGTAFVAFDGSYARAYDLKKGELLWEKSPDGSQGYRCSASGQLLALYKANSLYVYDPAGNVVFSTSTDQNIQSVLVGQTSAAVRFEDDSIQVIDKTGKTVDTIVSTEGKVMDYGFYSTSDLMWVLLLDDTGIEPKCVLNIYQPGKKLLAGFSTTEQLYYKPLMSGNDVYIVGTRSIDIRNTNDTSESSALIYGWTLKDYNLGEPPVLLFTLTDQGDHPTSLRVVSGGKAQDLRMPAGCTDLMMGASSVYGFAGQTLYSVPVAGGKTGSYSRPYAVDALLCRLKENRVLLSGENQVHLVTLP